MTDLTKVPDDELAAEWTRRLRLKVNNDNRGRPAKKLRPCPKCGEPYGAREMRTHTPKCTKGK